MLDINQMLQKSNAEMKNEHDDDDDDSSSKIHISVLHANLRDHMDWVLRKKRELASLSLDGDVKGLKRQFEEHSSFKYVYLYNHSNNGSYFWPAFIFDFFFLQASIKRTFPSHP